MKIWLLPVLFLLSACGDSLDPNNLPYSKGLESKEQISFIDENKKFYEKLIASCPHCKMAYASRHSLFEFDTTPMNVLATCTRYQVNGMTSIYKVTFSYYMLEVSESEQALVFAHEMGHCTLDADHYDEKLDIMNTHSMREDMIEAVGGVESIWKLFAKRYLKGKDVAFNQ